MSMSLDQLQSKHNNTLLGHIVLIMSQKSCPKDAIHTTAILELKLKARLGWLRGFCHQLKRSAQSGTNYKPVRKHRDADSYNAQAWSQKYHVYTAHKHLMRNMTASMCGFDWKKKLPPSFLLFCTFPTNPVKVLGLGQNFGEILTTWWASSVSLSSRVFCIAFSSPFLI